MKKRFYGKWKKMCAAVLAAGMLVTSCPVDVFAAVGDADNGCLKVYNRSSVGCGAGFDLTGKVSDQKTYTVSAKVMYTGGADTRTIMLGMENISAGNENAGWKCRNTVGSAQIKKGKWTEIKSETYQPKEGGNGGAFGTVKNTLYFETPWGSDDTGDFYVDDIEVIDNSDNSVLLKESFDADQGTGKEFDNAQVQWVKEGDEVPPDPSEIVPLQVNGDLETGDTTGWKVSTGGGESATLTATTEDKYDGNYSLKVSGRGGCTSGPMQDMSTKLQAGKKYKVTGRIKYTTGVNNKSFEIWYQNGSSFEDRTKAGAVSAKKGKWTQLYGTFTASNTGTDYVFIATPWTANPTSENDLMDFYVDDLVISLDDGEIPEEDPQEHDCIEGSTLVSGALKSGKDNKNVNPLFDYKFGADPYAITYDGRVYVYMTNDSQQLESVKDEHGYPTAGNKFDKINTLNVFSSADMVNWTDHGEISVDGKGAANLSWAPAVGHKTIDGKEKFFLYFANGGGGIYVLESDSPIGPFEAPETGSTLITRDMPQGSGIPYLFDPAVLVDDDGTGYLYYGGGFAGDADQDTINNPKTFRVVKLADNMVQLDGDANVIEAPGNFEDSGIHKYNGKYYFTYCSNFGNTLEETGRGNICAMVSDKPMEGFEFAGIVFPNQGTFFGAGTGGNNHHCFFEFNGKNYLTYHAQTLAVELGFFGDDQSGYRSTHIDEFEYDENGKIDVKGTWNGSSQVKELNPYERVEAETIAWSKGIKAAACQEEGSLVEGLNMMVTEITNGDYLAVSQADFGEGASKFTMHVAGKAGGTVELHLDSAEGENVGEVQVTPGDGNEWTDVSCDVDPEKVKGKHNLYLVFKGAEGQLMYADYWKFDEKPMTPEQKAEVDAVIALIGEIGEVTDFNADQETKIKAARTAYDKLTYAQKELVTNYNALTAAETVYQGFEDQKNAAAVIALIDGIGTVTDYNADQAAKVKAAREAYNKLTAAQKQLVTNYTTLTAAETAYQGFEDKAKADAVIALINGIGTVTEYNEEQETKIEAARAAYDELTPAQKEKVTNYTTLTAAETAYQGFEEQKEVDAVIALINGIGTVTKDSEEAINAAREAYDKLTDAQKAKVTNYNTLTEAEETYEDIKGGGNTDADVNDVISLINKIGTVTGDQASKDAIEAARAAYDKLTDAQKQKVTNFETLTAAEKAFKDIQDKAAADAVIALINKIGTVTGGSKADIDAAKAAYEKLTADQKKLVTNFATLTAAEKSYQEILDKDTVKKGETYNSGNYQYKVLDVSKKTVAVTKALKASKTIKVPNTVTIKGSSYKVTEIAKNAFKNNKKVETVTIGKNVTKIGASAFSGSKKLKKVTINSTVLTTIDKQAFYNCKKLATVKINSKKLKTVAAKSFKGTAKKIKVDVPNNKKKAYKKLFKKKSGISSRAVYK